MLKLTILARKFKYLLDKSASLDLTKLIESSITDLTSFDVLTDHLLENHLIEVDADSLSDEIKNKVWKWIFENYKGENTLLLHKVVKEGLYNLFITRESQLRSIVYRLLEREIVRHFVRKYNIRPYMANDFLGKIESYLLKLIRSRTDIFTFTRNQGLVIDRDSFIKNIDNL